MSYYNCKQGDRCEDCNGYIGPLDSYACLCSCHTRLNPPIHECGAGPHNNDSTDHFGWDDTPVTVCLMHKRFLPCRRGARDGGCVDSSEPADV